eukprot:3016387-Rhodomonas_salina.2
MAGHWQLCALAATRCCWQRKASRVRARGYLETPSRCRLVLGSIRLRRIPLPRFVVMTSLLVPF